MTRGTIVVIGTKSREIQLLCQRLEKEAFEVVVFARDSEAKRWLKRERPQAVLVTKQLSASFIREIVSFFQNRRLYNYIPVILVTDSDAVPVHVPHGVGEIFRLHTTPLSEIVNRLRLAIKLSQIAQQLKL